MQYRPLGRTNLKVSALCLGTMTWGEQNTQADAFAQIDRARDSGVNFIDTADAYVSGDSERLIGRFIKTTRNHWVLATKLGNKMNDSSNSGGLSRKWVFQACDDSLKRLRCDYLDIYYLHKEDHSTPLEETVRAIGGLITAGKIRYFGLSNYRSWRS